MKRLLIAITLILAMISTSFASTFYYKTLPGIVEGDEVSPFYGGSGGDSGSGVNLTFADDALYIAPGNSGIISYSLTGDGASGVSLSLSSEKPSFMSVDDVYLNTTTQVLNVPSSATSDAGNVDFTLTATDAEGNVVASDTVNIVISTISSNNMLTIWTVEAGETVQFPFSSGGSYDGHVDWGDGSSVESFVGIPISELSHTYDEAGTYKIRIDGPFCDITDFKYLFAGKTIPEGFDISNWDVSKVTTMNSTFISAKIPAGFSINSWDVSNVTDMTGMFHGVTFGGGFVLSSWDVSSVESMERMFYGDILPSTLDISSWNTSSLTTTYMMFQSATVNSSWDLSNWDISNVITMLQMFQNATIYADLNMSNLTAPNLTTTSKMFASAEISGSLNMNNFTSTSVSDMSSMFSGFTASEELLIESLNVPNAINMNTLMHNVKLPDTGVYINDWTVLSVENTSGMFVGTKIAEDSSFNGWDFSNVSGVGGFISDNSVLGDLYYDEDISNDSYSMFIKMIEYDTYNDISSVQKIYVGNNTCATDSDCINAEYELTYNGWWLMRNKTLTESDSLKTLWTVSAGQTVKFPFECDHNGPCNSIYSAMIDWGDGSNSEGLTPQMDLRKATHTYSNSGTYTVLISNKWPIDMSGLLCVSEIPTGFDMTNWNISNVSNMEYLFYSTDFKSDFILNGWDFSNITNDYGMFAGASFEGNIVYDEKVSNSVYSSFLQLLVNSSSAFLSLTPKGGQTISIGDNVCDENDIACSEALHILVSKGWNISDGRAYSIDEATALKSKWTVSAGEEVSFPVYSELYKGVIDWGDGTVEEFDNLKSLTHTYTNAGSYTTLMNGSWGTNLSGMFAYATIPSNLDISAWNISQVSIISNIFVGATIPSGFNINTWDISNIKSLNSVFAYAVLPDGFNISNWDTSAVTDMNYLFSGTTIPDNMDLSNWNTSKVSNMRYLFRGTNIPASLNVNNWDTSAVTNMSYAFSEATIPGGFDISGWNLSSVTSLEHIFYYANILEGFDISDWNISSVHYISNMFQEATIPNGFDMSGWDLSGVTSSYYNTKEFSGSSIQGDLIYDKTVSSNLYSLFVKVLAKSTAYFPSSTTSQKIYVGANNCGSVSGCSSAENTLTSKGWVITRTTAN